MVFIPPGLLITAPVLKKKLPSGERLGDKIVREEQQRVQAKVRRAVQRRRGGSGGQRMSQRQKDDLKRRQDEIRRIAEAEAQAEIERKAREQQARADAAERERQKIINERRRMIDAKARIVRKTSRDVKTGDDLRIIETSRNGVKIREIRNITRGTTRFERFAPGRAGGGVRQTTALTAPLRKALKPSPIDFLNAFVKNPSDFTTEEVIRGVREVGVVPAGARLGFPSFGEKIDVLPDEVRKLIEKKSEKDKKTIFDTLFILGLEFAIPINEAIVGIKQLRPAVKELIDDPSKLKKVLPNFWTELKKTGAEITAIAKVSKTRAVARIGGELFLIFAFGKILKVGGRITGTAARRINPFLKRIKKGKLTIRTTGGKTILTTGGTVRKIAQPLKKQAAVAGTKVTAVSAQADRLVNLIKTKRIIRKPIPGEALLSKTTKRLLKRFDDGVINSRQLRLLDDAIRKETKGAGNLLERSFFADPEGRFRPSRLGIGTQKDASLLDILRGDFTFKTSKPQILVFENVKVAKFPKALKDIEKALRSGKTLTNSQAKRLLEWQSKKTGQFKPIGALTREPEITLAAGEIIKKVKKVGTTIINGKKVSIVQVKVVKASVSVKKLLKKAKSGKITAKELKQLRNKLNKETGFKARLSRSKRLKPRARIPKRLKPRARRVTRVKRGRRFVRGKPVSKRVTRRVRKTKRLTRVTRRRGVVRRKGVTKRVTRRGATRRGVVGKVGRPMEAPRKRPSKVMEKRKVKIKKNGQGFDVFAKPIKTKSGRKAKRFIKINRVPLSKTRAKDLRNYIVDTSLGRTAKLKATKKKIGKSGLKVPSGYAAKTKRKFRSFRIRKGKRTKLKSNKVIEIKTRLLDTIQERQKITLRGRIKQITKPRKKTRKSTTRRGSIFSSGISRRPTITRKGATATRKQPQRSSVRRVKGRKVTRTPPKRKMSAAKRKKLLSNLVKARRVRMKNLKRRKR